MQLCESYLLVQNRAPKFKQLVLIAFVLTEHMYMFINIHIHIYLDTINL